jgi:hypothetical protein
MGVEFNENHPTNYNYQPNKGNGGISNLIIKLGLAKDSNGANKVMFIIIVVCVLLTIFIATK